MAHQQPIVLSHPVLIFDKEGKASVTLTNNDNAALAFKIKTNRPESYVVKPAEEVLRTRGASVTINITPMPNNQNAAPEDRFLIVFTNLSSQQVKIFDDARAQNSKTVLAHTFRSFWKENEVELRKIKLPRREAATENMPSSPATTAVTSSNSNGHEFRTPMRGEHMTSPSGHNVVPSHADSLSDASKSTHRNRTVIGLFIILASVVAVFAAMYELRRQGKI